MFSARLLRHTLAVGYDVVRFIEIFVFSFYFSCFSPNPLFCSFLLLSYLSNHKNSEHTHTHTHTSTHNTPPHTPHHTLHQQGLNMIQRLHRSIDSAKKNNDDEAIVDVQGTCSLK